MGLNIGNQARGKKNSLVEQNQLENSQIIKLSLISQALFKWENVDEIVSERFIEKSLFYDGTIYLVHEPTFGLCFIKGTPQGLNMYDEPLKIMATSTNLPTSFKKFYDYSEVAELKNNSAGIPTQAFIQEYAKRIVEVQKTIDLNITQFRTPFIVKTTKKDLLSKRNIMADIENFVPIIYVNEGGFTMSDIDTMQTSSPFYVDKLFQYKNSLVNEFKEFLGLDSANIFKKERIQTAEVNANDDILKVQTNIFYSERKAFCEKANTLFDLELNVKPIKESFAELDQKIDDFYYSEFDKDESEVNENG